MSNRRHPRATPPTDMEKGLALIDAEAIAAEALEGAGRSEATVWLAHQIMVTWALSSRWAPEEVDRITRDLHKTAAARLAMAHANDALGAR